MTTKESVSAKSDVKGKMPNNSGTLYICPTPIGNLEDITLRVLRILQEVDVIAAEDTRITQKLLNHFQINTKLISYYKHKEVEKAAYLVTLLSEGNDIALVSDSGTPLISDPGDELVKQARLNNIKIVPLPGACAIPTALSASSIAADGFIFIGFLPRQSTQKTEILLKYTQNELPVVFYESPNRVLSTLENILKTLGNVNLFITRELTKINEELVEGRVQDIIDHFKKKSIKGEFTIIIDKIPPKKIVYTDQMIKDLIHQEIQEGYSSSKAVKNVAQLTGIPKNKIYQLSIDINASN